VHRQRVKELLKRAQEMSKEQAQRALIEGTRVTKDSTKSAREYSPR
jgi:hypothetical protein